MRTVTTRRRGTRADTILNTIIPSTDTPSVTTANASGADRRASRHGIPAAVVAEPRTSEHHGPAVRSELAQQLGETLGLEILQELGRGARTVVYRVRRGDQLCALKVPVAPVPEDDLFAGITPDPA